MSAPRYRWPDEHRSAFLFSVDVDVESPYVWQHRGTPTTRLGELEQRRFGARVGLGRLLDLLHGHRIHGSFYVPGLDAERYPEMLPAIVDAGHEVGLHGFAHERVDALSDDENARAIERARSLFVQQTGRSPRGYRSPSWELVTSLPSILIEHGVTYDSSLMGYDHPYDLPGLVEVPVQWLTDDAIYFRFRGGGEDAVPPADPQRVLASWLEEWRGVHDAGGLFTLTVHPWISGRAQRIRMLEALLAEVTGRADVWFATAEEIAEHHASSENSGRYRADLAPADTSW